MGRSAGGAQVRGRAGRRALILAFSVEAVLLVAAVALTLAVADDGGPMPGDEWLTDRVQELPGWLEGPAEAVRLTCGTQVVVVIGLVAAGALWLTGHRREAVCVALALAALLVLQPLIKELVDRPRPDPALVERRAGFTSKSFPAGHIMSPVAGYGATLLAGSRLLPRRRAVASLLGLLLTVEAVANIYLGVHWPSDVLGGTLWGTVILLPVAFAMRARPKRATGRLV